MEPAKITCQKRKRIFRDLFFYTSHSSKKLKRVHDIFTATAFASPKRKHEWKMLCGGDFLFKGKKFVQKMPPEVFFQEAFKYVLTCEFCWPLAVQPFMVSSKYYIHTTEIFLVTDIHYFCLQGIFMLPPLDSFSEFFVANFCTVTSLLEKRESTTSKNAIVLVYDFFMNFFLSLSYKKSPE